MTDLSKFHPQYERRSELIDKEFLHGLTAQEVEELASLDAQLDAAEAAFYEPIKDGIQRLLDKLERGK